MRRPAPLVLLLGILLPTSVLAQDAPPDFNRLSYFVGEWQYEVGNSHGTAAWSEWSDSFVRGEEQNTTASGNTVELAHFFGVDSERNVFTWYRFWSNGNVQVAVGWVDGDTWTFLFDEPVGRKTRVVMVETSDSQMDFRWERSVSGGPWTVYSRGVMTKVR